MLVVAMILVGGYTRLSESGLSIVQWKPVTGALYPLSQESWQHEFELYQSSPEFKLKNFSMNLEEFKRIYSVEWAHRLLGRVLGLIFGAGFVYFAFTKRLKSREIKWLLLIAVCGALQGGIGWYMVKSGLSTLPQVSQYRLALHLIMAIMIYGMLMWLVFNSLARLELKSDSNLSCNIAMITLFLTLLQIITGALVAGLDAGLIYNTYPLMDGSIVPDDLFALTPWYKNLGENIATVQFIHRHLALVVMAFVMYLTFHLLVRYQDGLMKRFSCSLLLLVVLQFTLGVITLLSVVSLPIALLHQFGAILLFTNLLFIINLLGSGAR